jgi:lysophospholipase L1-like esterase
VRYVSLAEAVDLHDPILAPDGMHLNPTGNRTIAEKLVQPVLDILGLMPAQADRR